MYAVSVTYLIILSSCMTLISGHLVSSGMDLQHHIAQDVCIYIFRKNDYMLYEILNKKLFIRH